MKVKMEITKGESITSNTVDLSLCTPNKDLFAGGGNTNWTLTATTENILSKSMLLVVVLMPVRQMDTPMQSICTVGVGHTQQVEPLKAGNQKVHFL